MRLYINMRNSVNPTAARDQIDFHTGILEFKFHKTTFLEELWYASEKKKKLVFNLSYIIKLQVNTTIFFGVV